MQKSRELRLVVFNDSQALPAYAGIQQISYSSSWIHIKTTNLGARETPSFPSLRNLHKDPVETLRRIRRDHGSVAACLDIT